MKQNIDIMKTKFMENKEAIVGLTCLTALMFFDIYYFISGLVFIFLLYDFILSLHLELHIDVNLLPRVDHQNKICLRIINNKQLVPESSTITIKEDKISVSSSYSPPHKLEGSVIWDDDDDDEDENNKVLSSDSN